MTNESDDSVKHGAARVNASSAATARKIKRLPPGEHLVELRAKAVPDQMVLRVAAYSVELQAGMVLNLDRIFGPEPATTDAKGTRAYEAQGTFWLSMLVTCGLEDSELQDITLDQLAEKISGKPAIAIVNQAGYWSRVKPVRPASPSQPPQAASPQSSAAKRRPASCLPIIPTRSGGGSVRCRHHPMRVVGQSSSKAE